MKDMLKPPTPPTNLGSKASESAAGRTSKGFDIVDLRQYFHIVVKRIWLVALCFVISLAVMVVMMVRQVPYYRCHATLLLSQGLPIPARLAQREVETLGDYIVTQQRIIQSNMMIQRAKERMDRPLSECNRLLTGVSVIQVWKTSMLNISVTSLDPVFGAEFANALAREYMAFKSEQRMDTSQATVINLTQQANKLNEELKKAEERVVAFKKENKVIAIQERGNIAADYLAQLASEAAGYRTERMMLEAQQPLIKKASDEIVLTTLASSQDQPRGAYTLGISDIQNTNTVLGASLEDTSRMISQGLVSPPDWRNLQRKKGSLESSLSVLRKKYKDAHPAIQMTLGQLQQVETQLEQEKENALQQYYAKLESLAIKEEAAKRVEMEWEDEALEVSRKAHEYGLLQKEVARLQSFYNLIFTRLKEIDVSIGIEPESVRVMEWAKPAGGPVKPRKMQSLFIAALIGLGVGLGLVFGLEYIDDSIRYPEEVTQGLGLPFFGVIPSANWDPGDLSSHILSNIDQKSGLSEAYRNVRSALLFSGMNESIKSVVVGSAVPREGKTTTCLNLAVSLAQAGERVLIVDADMRRGELHKFFGLEAGRGLSDMLAGQSKPESVIQRTHLANLDMIATGPFPPNPAELILRPELNSFLDYARRTYDRVLFDLPPLMAVSESGIMSSLVDGVVFVVWAGQTSRKLAQMAIQVLHERGANILGCVLNNLEFGRVGYYYYSTYYGYYDYDYRYEKSEPARHT